VDIDYRRSKLKTGKEKNWISQLKTDGFAQTRLITFIGEGLR